MQELGNKGDCLPSENGGTGKVLCNDWWQCICSVYYSRFQGQVWAPCKILAVARGSQSLFSHLVLNKPKPKAVFRNVYKYNCIIKGAKYLFHPAMKDSKYYEAG